MCITLSLLENQDLMCDTHHIHSYRAWDRKCICFFWTVGVYSNFFTAPFIFLFLFSFVVSSAERKKDQVCSHSEYQRAFERLNSLPSGVEHVIIQLGADTLFFYFSDNFTILYPLSLQSRHPYCLSTHGVPRDCAGV